MIFVVIVAVLVLVAFFYIQRSMSLLHKRSWEAILANRIPRWFDMRLAPVLKAKYAQRHKKSLSSLNMLYMYLSKGGRVGDCSWQFVERLAKLGLSKLPSAQTYDLVVGITSGGALAAPFVAEQLGVPCEYVSVKKYADKGVMKRISTFCFGSSTKKHQVLPVHGSDVALAAQGKRVLLVDDQLASGTTLDSATLHIKKLGAKSIHRLCLASLLTSYENTTIAVNHLILCWPWGLDS